MLGISSIKVGKKIKAEKYLIQCFESIAASSMKEHPDHDQYLKYFILSLEDVPDVSLRKEIKEKLLPVCLKTWESDHPLMQKLSLI